MICKENYLGKIYITDRFIKELVSRGVESCFGVAAMGCRSFREFLINRGKRAVNRGISVSRDSDELTADLHIAVAYGTNITAIAESIKNKVSFVLNEYAGMPVRAVNVFIDGIV